MKHIECARHRDPVDEVSRRQTDAARMPWAMRENRVTNTMQLTTAPSSLSKLRRAYIYTDKLCRPLRSERRNRRKVEWRRAGAIDSFILEAAYGSVNRLWAMSSKALAGISPASSNRMGHLTLLFMLQFKQT